MTQIVLSPDLTFALMCSVVAFVYSVILTEGGEALSWWYKWLERKLMPKTAWMGNGCFADNDGISFCEPDRPYYVKGFRSRIWRMANRKASAGGRRLNWVRELRDFEWIFKPLVGCEKCVAGQIALWGFLLWRGLPLSLGDGFHLLFTICAAILITVFTKIIYQWLTNL